MAEFLNTAKVSLKPSSRLLLNNLAYTVLNDRRKMKPKCIALNLGVFVFVGADRSAAGHAQEDVESLH